MKDLGDNSELNLVPDAVLVIDAGGRIVFANKNCQDLLGWRTEELLGRTLEQLVPRRFAHHVELRRQFMAQPARRPMGAGLELYVLNRAGGEVEVDISLNPIDLAGVPHVVASLRDLREQRTALQVLHLLTVAVNAAASGVVITDSHGVILQVNPAACRMTGYAAHELIGQRPSLLKSGRHDAGFYAGIWATVSSGASWSGTIINRRKDGTEYHEEQTIAPVKNHRGEVTHYIAIKQDVTERIHAEEMLRETRDELAQRVREVEALHAKLREQAIRDPLSGLFNRGYLDEILPRELARSRRDGSRLTLAMIDIDHFKRINDSHGHIVGDRVIAGLGCLLRAKSRASDLAFRYGGEEFAVLLAGTGLQDGARCADQWREGFGRMEVLEGASRIQATLSAGIAEWTRDESAADLLARADAALYQAKREGRNRVVSAPATAPGRE